MEQGLGKQRSFPELSRTNVREIFSHVYDVMDRKVKYDNDQLHDFITLALAYSEYIRKYRPEDMFLIYPIAREMMGEFETNSKGTDLWMCLIIALEELYQLSREELLEMLKKAKGLP